MARGVPSDAERFYLWSFVDYEERVSDLKVLRSLVSGIGAMARSLIDLNRGITMLYANFQLIGGHILRQDGHTGFRDTGYYLVGIHVHGPRGDTGYRLQEDRFYDATGRYSHFHFEGTFIYGPQKKLPWA